MLLTAAEWDARPRPPGIARSFAQWIAVGDGRLADLRFDGDPASRRLWEFVLSEEDRLRAARAAGSFIVGAMKDLGTVSVLVHAIPGARAFYPDGAWWLPCLQRRAGGQLEGADRLGIGESFCPVRALLGCYAAGSDFPAPDLDVCAVGATCDDFSAVAQRLAGLGRPLLWWELPAFRDPDPDEAAVALPDGGHAPTPLVAHLTAELGQLRARLGRAAGAEIGDHALAAAIREANAVRALVRGIRTRVLAAPLPPLPALELLLVEILALHFCSDYAACRDLLEDIDRSVRARCAAGDGHGSADAVRVAWINPVADLRVLSWLEESGGRLVATDFMTAQALQPIPEDLPPLEALARTALCDRMIGVSARRARLAAADARAAGAEAVVVARIPGASHCWDESAALGRALAAAHGHLPLAEIEVPPLADAAAGQIRGRLEALVETALMRRTTPP
jgi:hypothetical protein